MNLRISYKLKNSINILSQGATLIATVTVAFFSNSLTAPGAFAFSFTQLSEKTGFEHESTDLIASILYARPSSTYSHMATSGANRVNQNYANGTTSTWYIEEQRFGANAIISGLIHNDQKAIDAGFQMFDWGFSQQQNDGSFLPTNDPFHSTSMFLGSAAYSLLTLQESPNAELYTDIIQNYVPKLHSAGRWLIRKDIWDLGMSNNSPYTHRNYTVATALGLTGKLTGDQILINYANQSITQGLNKQWSNGVNPEKDGYDSSYQMAGALQAMRWLNHFDEDSLASSVATMINNALIWEESKILLSGEVSTQGNTRTNGTEITRTGQSKSINQREIIYGFSYWSSITGDAYWRKHASDITRYYYSDDLLVMSNLEYLSLLDLEISIETQDVPESSQIAGIILLFLVYLFAFPYSHRSLS
ncbi:hypothetical protein N836_21380 [Leptolyngbya sp. Heron Island J]|uniref:hypothetical protein n=1 Tax=Leptolyngbya sp. Heron Island J TaxID=1385935 RepID=UPI0003B990A8|nr:hypothetical protein [Leptolyngbya sp. Heron Island J]ESA33410.1 hypothetical protein N836_21380 [Leptolyngbya sp. Heron Island J]